MEIMIGLIIGFVVLWAIVLGSVMGYKYSKINNDPRWNSDPQTPQEYFRQLYEILPEWQENFKKWYKRQAAIYQFQADFNDSSLGNLGERITGPVNFLGAGVKLATLNPNKKPQFGLIGLNMFPLCDLLRKKEIYFTKNLMSKSTPEEIEAFNQISSGVGITLLEARDYQNHKTAKSATDMIMAGLNSTFENLVLIGKVILIAGVAALILTPMGGGAKPMYKDQHGRLYDEFKNPIS